MKRFRLSLRGLLTLAALQAACGARAGFPQQGPTVVLPPPSTTTASPGKGGPSVLLLGNAPVAPCQDWKTHCAPDSPPTCCGASEGDPVDLWTGDEQYSAGPDLVSYSAIGIPAVYQRTFSSYRAWAGDSSPGLPVGWTDNFDYSVSGLTSASPSLYYPNGSSDTLTPAATPTAAATYSFVHSNGVPYNAQGHWTGTSWDSLDLTFKNRAVFHFAFGGGSKLVLQKISPLDGAPLQMDRDATDNRLTGIEAVAVGGNVLLMGFTYAAQPAGGPLRLTEVIDYSVAGWNHVLFSYTYDTATGVSEINQASQIAPRSNGSPAFRGSIPTRLSTATIS